MASETLSNTNQAFELQETKLPALDKNSVLENGNVGIDSKEPNERKSENDSVNNSLIGFTWSVLASFFIAAGTVCVQVSLQQVESSNTIEIQFYNFIVNPFPQVEEGDSK